MNTLRYFIIWMIIGGILTYLGFEKIMHPILVAMIFIFITVYGIFFWLNKEEKEEVVGEKE